MRAADFSHSTSFAGAAGSGIFDVQRRPRAVRQRRIERVVPQRKRAAVDQRLHPGGGVDRDVAAQAERRACGRIIDEIAGQH